MYEKKQVVHVSPDLAKLKEVVINQKTRIYIGKDEDSDEARKRYFDRIEAKKV